MTVLENLDVGGFVCRDRRSAEFAADLERAFTLFPRLAERRNQVGASQFIPRSSG